MKISHKGFRILVINFIIVYSIAVLLPGRALAIEPKERDHLAQDIREGREQTTYTADEIYRKTSQFFGTTSKKLAEVVTHTFSHYGEPNAYIEGEEFSGSFLFGLRYGQGQLVTKDGRKLPIYWQGPSFGVDIGGNAAKVFTLVYHLENPQQVYKRIGNIVGSVYVVGGFSVALQQSGNVMLAPIHTGVGARLGASIGYLSYSHTKQWTPF